MLTIITFILILSFLVFVHELGHFIAAKRAKITVEEFAIGFPPRLVKLWQDEGSVTLNGEQYIIGRRTQVPRNLKVGSRVNIETRQRADNQSEITKFELVTTSNDEQTEASTASIVEAVQKPTEYTINAIPFGGYVKMVGEEDPSAPGSFASKSKRARFVVLVAGAVMNLITAVIVFAIMFSTGIPEPLGKTVVVSVAPNSPAETSGILVGDLIHAADGQSLANHAELVSYVGEHLGEQISLSITRDEQEISLDVTPRENPPEGEGSIGVGIRTAGLATIMDVMPDSVAEKANLKAQDVILKANDYTVHHADLLSPYLAQNKDQTVSLLVRRNENDEITEQIIDVIPTAQSAELPATIGVQLGNQADSRRITQLPLGQSLVSGVYRTGEIIMFTFLVPIAVMRDAIPAEQARPVGPVGIFTLTNSAVGTSVEIGVPYPILGLIAIISTALAITNLLPLPALDGGRIMFIIIEAIRGKRVSPEQEGMIHFIGLALLLTLLVVVTFNDISNPIDVPDWTTLFY
ncbi:MAG: RIP metalloprotease RseP [Chloroflexota bacterium]